MKMNEPDMSVSIISCVGDLLVPAAAATMEANKSITQGLIFGVRQEYT